LAFYEAALVPLNIQFFLPFKGEDDHPDLWGFGDGSTTTAARFIYFTSVPARI
jgi:hypothetical protein